MVKHRARRARPGARLPDRRADRGAPRRRDHRDGRARRGRLRRLLAGRGAAHRHPGAAARAAVRRDVRPPRVAAAAGLRTSVAPASRTTAKSRPASACRRFPAAAETIALATIFALIRETGARVHLCRLSSAQGVAMVRAARRDGLAVTCDVAVHHLHLCDVDIGWFDTQCPPGSAAARDARPRRAARRRRRRHHRRRLLRPHPGRRRRQATAVRRVRARRHRPGTSAVADAQMGARGQRAARCGHWRGSPRRRPRCWAARAAASAIGGAGGPVRLRSRTRTGRSSPATLSSQGRNTPFLGLECRAGCGTTLVGGRIVFER